jgi:uncharacterized membrane protein YebE (DUF533 family)
MKRTTLSTLVLTLIIGASTLTAGYALAQPVFQNPAAMPGFDKHQAKQQERFNQAVASGRISPADQTRGQMMLNQLNATIAAAKADGVITKEEREAIKAQQKQFKHAFGGKKHGDKHFDKHDRKHGDKHGEHSGMNHKDK